MPATVVLVSSPTIKIDGVALAAARYDDIIDLRVVQSTSIPSQLTLRLSDADFTLVDGDVYAIGKSIEVAFPNARGVVVTVFQGEIVGLGSDQSVEATLASELIVTAYDRGHRLGHTTRIRTFQQQKYSSVINTIAQEEGLRADVTDTTLTFDYLIQTSTNFALLNEISFRTGYDWSVDGDTLHFGPRAETVSATVEYGTDVRRLKTRFTASSEFDQVTVRSWDPLSKSSIVGTSAVAAGRVNGSTGLATSGQQAASAYAGTRATSALVAASTDEAQQLASAIGRRMASADLSARCECIGRPDIRAGGMVSLTKAGTRLSGTYYVTTVEHSFGRSGEFATTFTTGGLERSSIVDLLGGGAGEVEQFGRVGLTIGIVTNNKDPDGNGRVRVKFPALTDAEESWWARVVSPGAGSAAGLLMMPQINDEVLVGFEHGDLRRPFVIGGLWGAKAKPPTAPDTFLAQNKVIDWGLKTAAGHTLTIRGGDQPADKHFKLRLADGTLLYLGSDKTEVVTQNKSIELRTGQASVTLTDRGDIVLKGMNITIDAQQALKVNGLTVEAKASTSLKLEGSSAAELKGGAQATVQASGIAAVKGSLVQIN